MRPWHISCTPFESRTASGLAISTLAFIALGDARLETCLFCDFIEHALWSAFYAQKKAPP
ncbi:MAG: hypothetical protein C0514_01575 [Candidatus Puniceispirillum sp.]|nr:hypothetical protein [Candidatus Puniceispirillum sp.]